MLLFDIHLLTEKVQSDLHPSKYDCGSHSLATIDFYLEKNERDYIATNVNAVN